MLKVGVRNILRSTSKIDLVNRVRDKESLGWSCVHPMVSEFKESAYAVSRVYMITMEYLGRGDKNTAVH